MRTTISVCQERERIRELKIIIKKYWMEGKKINLLCMKKNISLEEEYMRELPVVNEKCVKDERHEIYVHIFVTRMRFLCLFKFSREWITQSCIPFCVRNQ